jgi:hypothetical protein
LSFVTAALLGYCPNMTINPAPKRRSAPHPINDIDERLAFEPVAMMLGNRYSPRNPSKRRLLRGTRPVR